MACPMLFGVDVVDHLDTLRERTFRARLDQRVGFGEIDLGIGDALPVDALIATLEEMAGPGKRRRAHGV